MEYSMENSSGLPFILTLMHSMPNLGYFSELFGDYYRMLLYTV